MNVQRNRPCTTSSAPSSMSSGQVRHMDFRPAAFDFVAVFFTAALVAQCNVVLPTITPAPPIVTDQDACAAACQNLQALGCHEAQPVVIMRACVMDGDCLGPDGGP